jgi:transposase
MRPRYWKSLRAISDKKELVVPVDSTLEALLSLGDPDGEVALAYSVKEAVARFYETPDPEAAADLLRDIIDFGSKRSAPYEVRRLARTLGNWFEPITA